MSYKLTKIAIKLPLVIVLVGTFASVAIGFTTLLLSKSSLEDKVSQSILSGAKGFQHELKLYFETVEADVSAIAQMRMTADAVIEFSGYFDRMNAGGKATEDLQKTYIHDNPHPDGEKDKLVNPNDFSPYGILHSKIHPNFSTLRKTKGYADIFLFDLEGNLVYSVLKREDFATNFNDGPFAQSGLGQVYREVLSDDEMELSFRDFRSYAANGNVAASFIAHRIHANDGSTVGVLAYQISMGPLNSIMNSLAQINKNVESFLMSEDTTLQSYSINSFDIRPLDTIALTELESISGNSEAKILSVGHPNGGRMLSAFIPLEFAGTRFQIVNWVNEKVAFADIKTMTGSIIAAVTLGAILSTAIGILFARTITRPLGRLNTAVEALADGREADMSDSKRADEIGQVFCSMDVVHKTGAEAVRVRAALAKCEAMFMIANLDDEIVYLNKPTMSFFEKNEQKIAQGLDGFKTAELIGHSLSYFHNHADVEEGVFNDVDENGRSLLLHFDDLKIMLMINSVLREDGKRLGTVIEWRDVTDELTLRAGLDTVVSAANRGDFSQRIQLESDDANAKRIADGMNSLTSVVDKATEDLAELLRGLRTGDLTGRIEANYQGRFGELADAANGTIGDLNKTVLSIQQSVRTVAQVAGTIEESSIELSNRTEQSASKLEETAAAMEDVSDRIKQNNDHALEARTHASSASKSAKEGGAVLNQTIEAMQEIEQSSEKISQIIAVMEDISFQTNLLALNASIEAARAGEAGKGFSVVATEVRSLAGRSAEAANDVSELISTSSTQVSTGSTLVQQTGTSLQKITAEISEVADLVAGISEASKEQTDRVQEVNGAVNALDQSTQNNAQVAQTNSEATNKLSIEARNLAQLVEHFKTSLVEDDVFETEVPFAESA